MPKDIDYTMQYNKYYYENNSEKEKLRVKQRRLELVKYVNNYKSNKSCNFKERCLSLINNDDDDVDSEEQEKNNSGSTTGSNDSSRSNSISDSSQIINLEFHHKDPDTKFKTISAMVYQGYSLKRIKEEIKKCVLLCRRCHMENYHSD